MAFPIHTHDGQVTIVSKRIVIGKAITSVLTDENGGEWVLDPRTNEPVYVSLAEAEQFLAESEAIIDAAPAAEPPSVTSDPGSEED